MPVWLRKFTFQSLKAHFEKIKEATEKSVASFTSNENKKSLKSPNFKYSPRK